jgi:hypothetical protein
MTITQRPHVTPTFSAPELRGVDPRTLLVGYSRHLVAGVVLVLRSPDGRVHSLDAYIWCIPGACR